MDFLSTLHTVWSAWSDQSDVVPSRNSTSTRSGTITNSNRLTSPLSACTTARRPELHRQIIRHNDACSRRWHHKGLGRSLRHRRGPRSAPPARGEQRLSTHKTNQPIISAINIGYWCMYYTLNTTKLRDLIWFDYTCSCFQPSDA